MCGVVSFASSPSSETALASLKAWLPRGTTLGTHQWEARHRGMTMLLWAHVVALPLLALGYGSTIGHALLEGLLIAAFALPATLLRAGDDKRRLRALIVTFGLLTCSATLVHIMNGAIEAHFHYFVIVTVLALYEEWATYLAAIAYVLLQHGVGSALAHDSIFNHDADPWLWASVHAGFIAALCVANVVNWRAAEALRAEVVAHAGDLERSNRELEEFAYVASHDLAEPLRTISSYLDLIERRAQLDDDSRQFFAFARGGAERMRRLIDDLLRYSRAGRSEISRRPVQAAEVIDQTMRDLAAEIEAAGARVECDDLPVVEADPVLLRQLFQNLVSNAVKFRDDEPPVVRVSGRELAEGWEFTVQDNGIGVPADHAERVFKMFQRLHHRYEYDGTGIGLSVCQRIVERHGGRIRVEPAEGRGSRFVFTIANPRRKVRG
jgi:signal transduction histidine kinase